MSFTGARWGRLLIARARTMIQEIGITMVHAVILAGGSGRRLWPLSRQQTPKQVIPFGASNLLSMALDRLAALPNISSLVVATTQEHAAIITEKIPASVRVIAEPRANNTACAILYSCLQVVDTDPNAHMVFIPADHVIEGHDEYIHALTTLIDYTQHHDVLGLIGISPSYAATHYGYIERSTDVLNNYHDLFAVNSFHEKPSHEVASIYITDKRMLWNAGIFCASAQKIIELFMHHAPELYAQVRAGAFDEVVPVSFDTAIVERVHECVVVQGAFRWADVGTLQHFIEQVQQIHPQKAVLHDADNVKTYSTHDKLIVVYGVNNVCVVETHDAIIVVNTQHAPSMDRVVDLLRKEGLESFL